MLLQGPKGAYWWPSTVCASWMDEQVISGELNVSTSVCLVPGFTLSTGCSRSPGSDPAACPAESQEKPGLWVS